MYIKIVMLVMFVFSSSSVFAKEIQFEDLSADVQEELLSGLNNKERAATGYVKKNPSKKVVVKKSPVKKNVPDAAFLKAVARQLEMDQLDADVEAFKKKETEKASVRVETASQPVVNVVLPRNEVAEKAFTKRMSAIIDSAKPAEKQKAKLPFKTKLNLQLIELRRLVVKSDVHVSVGVGLSGMNNWEHVRPDGFSAVSSDQVGMKSELSLHINYKWLELQLMPLPESTEIPEKFYGTGMGGVKVIRKNMIIANITAIQKEKYSFLVGFGYEETKLEDSISLGGINFPSKVNKRSPVFQFTGRYVLSKWLSAEGGYRIRNVQVESSIPGVPDLTSAKKNSMFIKLVSKLF